MESTIVVLGLGSNRSYQNQSPRQLLDAACLLLAQRIKNLKASSLYKTAPLYYQDQEDFFNMVVAGHFDGSPRDLLTFTQQVETQLGRDRSKEIFKGPRSMDIDIELFGSEKVEEPDLIIPHAGLTERAFVLVPMLEVFFQNADLSINKSFYSECLESLSHQEIVKVH